MRKFRRIDVKLMLAGGCLGIAVLFGILANRWWVLRQVDQAREIAERGEQLWPREMQAVLSNAESATFSRAFLAERLSSDANAAIVAEGLIMLARYPSKNAHRIFEEHLKDKRVNHLLYTNGELARLCLCILAKTGKKKLTDEETALLRLE